MPGGHCVGRKQAQESGDGRRNQRNDQSGNAANDPRYRVIAVGLIGVFLLLDSLDVGPWKDLKSPGQLLFVVASGAI